jgi:hypothetical protein
MRAPSPYIAVMGSGLLRSSRALATTFVLTVLFAAPTATAAGAASQSGDTAIARGGAFVASDFPAGFASEPATAKSHRDNIVLAKGVAGCGPYIKLQKAVAPLPQAKSPRFGDASRSIGNEVDVFPTEKAARAAIVLYSKSSIVGCLENLFEKQARQDPDLRGSLDDVVVNIARQDIAGLGDDSVVYEGSTVLTGTDGASQQIGIGSAAVRVGRTVDVVTYTTSGTSLTEVLTPAIDASVSRLRSAIAQSDS